MTNRFFERRDLVTRFFDSATADTAWRTQLLTKNKITLVVDSGSADASVLRDSGGAFQLAFSRPHARIYRFNATETLDRLHGRQP